MRILFLGGGHSEYPIIIEARKLGHQIFTLGRIRFEHVDSTYHVFIDYSDIPKIQDFCLQNEIERIIAGCNDFAAIAAAQVSEALGIPHEISLAAAIELHNKNQWSRSFQQLSIPIPQSQVIDLKKGEIPDLKLPWEPTGKLLVKPVDMTGGKGIFLSEVSRLAIDISMYKSNSRQSKLIIQEYLEGSLHSAFILFARDEIRVFFADEEIDSNFKVRMAVMPSELENMTKTSIRLHMEKYIEYLGLKQGLLHLQFILTGDSFKVVDLCARPPGDLFILLPLYAFDFNFSEFWAQSEKISLEISNVDFLGNFVRVVEKPWENLAEEFNSKIFRLFEIKTEMDDSGNYERTNLIKFYKFESVEETVEFKTQYMSEIKALDHF